MPDRNISSLISARNLCSLITNSLDRGTPLGYIHPQDGFYSSHIKYWSTCQTALNDGYCPAINLSIPGADPLTALLYSTSSQYSILHSNAQLAESATPTTAAAPSHPKYPPSAVSRPLPRNNVKTCVTSPSLRFAHPPFCALPSTTAGAIAPQSPKFCCQVPNLQFSGVLPLLEPGLRTPKCRVVQWNLPPLRVRRDTGDY